jgi:hypothetical protein
MIKYLELALSQEVYEYLQELDQIIIGQPEGMY